jgi:hypothetical protein
MRAVRPPIGRRVKEVRPAEEHEREGIFVAAIPGAK